jgi:hypothetical protein
MVWLFPAALAGLLAVAGPVLVHLLRRQRARRIVVPSVRFVRASDLSAVRLRRPSDPWLLALRAAIVASAALALARPLLLTDARVAGWSARTARAVIVDTSASAGPHVDRARVDAEIATGDPAVTIDTAHLATGLRRAAAWLAESPPARREIVVFSDFQAGALDAGAVAQVPADIGLRFSPVDPAAVAVQAPTLSVLDGSRTLHARLSLAPETTAVAYDIAGAALDGLEIQAPLAQSAGVASLVRVVAAAGAVAPSPAQPIVIRFAGADGAGEAVAAAPANDWTAAAADRLLRSPDVAGVHLRVASAKGALVVDVDADPGSVEAARVVKAALDARHDTTSMLEREPRRIDDATLAAWSRPAGPADATAWRHTDESDGRWFWALALVLLLIEAIVRRAPAPAAQARETHAA